MNREALDEFFAKADDVLEHWEPSDDAMVARVADEDADLPLADSYYTQHDPWAGQWAALSPIVDPFRRYMNEVMAQINALPITQWVEFDADRLDWSTGPQGIVNIPRIETVPSNVRPTWFADIPASRIYYGIYRDETLPQEETPSARALRLRRERNTGPASQVGLDGHYRRNARG